MNQMKDFIGKYLSGYLNKSRSKINEGPHVPPTVIEIEQLMTFLQEKGLNPVIVGSMALIKHLKPTYQELNEDAIRLTNDVDLFISQNNLPTPPPGWRRDLASAGVISWIAPSGGYVDFLIAGHSFPDNTRNPKKIGIDPESEKMGCPTADLASLYLLKLNSFREKDLFDILGLARKIGIPSEIERMSLNSTQKDNLEIVKLWLSHDGIEKSPF